jgi:hypothetical protein
MTEPTRLPKSLRRLNAANRAALPPYDRIPVTTTDGAQVVGWSWPPAPVADPVPEDDGPSWIDPADRCHNCGGWGTWTETLVGSNGRDEEVDYPCGACDAKGIEP